MAGRNSGSARRRLKDDTRPKQRNATTAEGAERKGNSGGQRDAFYFDDPVTGGVGKADANADGSWVLDAWGTKENGWFYELAEAIGLDDAYELKKRPRELLAPYIKRDVRRREPAPPPTDDDVKGGGSCFSKTRRR